RRHARLSGPPRVLLWLAVGHGPVLRSVDRKEHVPPSRRIVQTSCGAGGTVMSARRVVEADVCIIGSGISAAMVADKLTRTTKKSIVVVEAGNDVVPMAERGVQRERFLSYGENPWPNDHLDGFEIDG